MAIQIIHTEEEFADERGVIKRIIDQEEYTFKAVLHITSKAGSIRSNHYHKKDAHYIYVASGSCEYSEKPAYNESAKVETVILNKGDAVFSRPGIIHAVKFLEDTVLYAYTTEERVQDKYEEDTIRVKII